MFFHPFSQIFSNRVDATEGKCYDAIRSRGISIALKIRYQIGVRKHEKISKYFLDLCDSRYGRRRVLPGVHQIQRVHCQNHALCRTYPLFSAGHRVFFLLLLVLEKNLPFTGAKTGRVLAVYHIGLNLTAVMLVVRGVTQVVGTNLSKGADAAISGMAGIGHILLGVSLVLLLLQIRRSVPVSQS